LVTSSTFVLQRYTKNAMKVAFARRPTVRPYKVEGVPQLRAEVKRKDGKGEGFRRVGSWSCPPLAKNLW
jgi:hypothetical protein